MARKRGSAVPPVIHAFVKALVVTAKAVVLYPPASNVPLQTAQAAANALGLALGELPELRFVVGKRDLFFEGESVFPSAPAYQSFAFDLYARRLAEVRFHSGTEPRDIVAFLSVLRYSPEEVAAAGGYEARLWENGVSAITVAETHFSVVDAEASAETVPELSREQIDTLVSAAYSGREADARTLVSFLGDSRAVAIYLRQISAHAPGESGKRLAADRFAELAEIAYRLNQAADRQALFRSLGQALGETDPDLRRSLLLDELLPEARTNEAVASVFRELATDSVCRMVVEGMDESSISRDGLARAIRTLAMISTSERDEVVSAARSALVGAGGSEAFSADVLERAFPSRVAVRESAEPAPQSERPVDVIMHLIDIAPSLVPSEAGQSDPEVSKLAEEARRGVTDGDVIMALVSMAVLDTSDHSFATSMSMLEDSLDLLIERGEIDIAADVADALAQASEDPALSDEQRRRMRKAVGHLSKPGDIRAIALALRLYQPGTAEYDAAQRLLDSLGGVALEPLLEHLAQEPDMTARKGLVDLLSELAPEHIDELGRHVSDGRWYFVRNVVSILGATRSSAVLPYLERTVRHPEARVRREAIRALAGVPDSRAQDVLTCALGDTDAQNVQLAARYLAAGNVRAAVPVLEQVARGEGRGNRDIGPRVEAIETLGRLGATESLPTLEQLAGRRGIIGGAKTRELRSAAESAIGRIRGGRA